MMLLKYLLPLSPWLISAYAQEQGIGDGNFTVAFLPTSEDDTCKQEDIAKAISLTTDTIPSAFTCFNLTDLFTQSSDNGYNDDVWKTPDNQPTFGVNYTLSNRGSFKAGTNYTNVWYHQANQTAKADEEGTWVFYTYAFEACIQNGGDAFALDDYPWFETSCQTKDEGECRQVPQTVKSFAIGPAAPYDARHGKCEVWATMGAASTLNGRNSALLVVATTMAAFIMM